MRYYRVMGSDTYHWEKKCQHMIAWAKEAFVDCSVKIAGREATAKQLGGEKCDECKSIQREKRKHPKKVLARKKGKQS